MHYYIIDYSTANFSTFERSARTGVEGGERLLSGTTQVWKFELLQILSGGISQSASNTIK